MTSPDPPPFDFPSDRSRSEHPEVPAVISSITEPIDEALRSLISAERHRWVAVHDSLREPFDALEALVLGGGKRIRPAFFHWAHVGSGGDPAGPSAVRAAAAIEMLHAFALAHDDVMDRSESRRGVRSTWRRFADAHLDRTWNGDPERFGDAVAILVGDLAHVAADHLVERSDPTVARIWDDLRFEVNIGQYLDVLAGAKGNTSQDDARLILEYKTGRYSVQRPLHLGAAMAGAHELLADPFTRYGRPVGVAFQLRDDMLGAFGDTHLTGKPVGDDLREGKPTLLLALAFDQASPAQAAVLGLAGNPDLDDEQLGAIQEVLVETGATESIEREIRDLTDEALSVLVTMKLEQTAKDALAELARFVAFRTH
jgi:geranylgeranyl diphosphate synthase type I